MEVIYADNTITLKIEKNSPLADKCISWISALGWLLPHGVEIKTTWA